MDEIVRRAMAAWFRSGGSDQPPITYGIKEYQKKKYVVLENVNGLLAVYRLRNDGQLKRLKRWPEPIEKLSSDVHAGKKDKVRVNEVGPEDIEDPELREIMNELLCGINRSNERLEQLNEGKLSAIEVNKLRRDDDKKIREIKLRIKEYKRRR